MALLFARFIIADTVESYLLEIRNVKELIAVCTDIKTARRILKRPVDALLTFFPVYDELMANGAYCDDVELLEDELFVGDDDDELEQWLAKIERNTPRLPAGEFGSQIFPDAFDCPVSLSPPSVPDDTDKAFMFRHILSMQSRIGNGGQVKPGEIKLIERILIYTGRTEAEAREKAIESGKLTAEIDAEWDSDNDYRFRGIESFCEIRPADTFPLLLATETRQWPWEFDLKAYLSDLLDDILQINAKRKQENLNPYWE